MFLKNHVCKNFHKLLFKQIQRETRKGIFWYWERKNFLHFETKNHSEFFDIVNLEQTYTHTHTSKAQLFNSLQDFFFSLSLSLKTKLWVNIFFLIGGVKQFLKKLALKNFFQIWYSLNERQPASQPPLEAFLSQKQKMTFWPNLMLSCYNCYVMMLSCYDMLCYVIICYVMMFSCYVMMLSCYNCYSARNAKILAKI